MGAFLSEGGNATLLFVYLIYGLSFFMLGTAALLAAPQRDSPPFLRNLGLLGLFGLVHGAKEFMDAWRLVAGTFGDAAFWVGEGLLLVSYLFLLEFARRTIQQDTANVAVLRGVLGSRWIYLLPACGVIVLGPSDPFALDAAFRYWFGFPGALATGYAAWRGLQGYGWPHATMAGTFFIYAFAGAVVTELPPIFPDWAPTERQFLETTGFPVQALRASCAFLAMMSLTAIVRRTIRETLSKERKASADLRVLTEEIAKQAKQYKLERDFSQYLVEVAPVYILEISSGGAVTFVNSHFEQMTGLSPGGDDAEDDILRCLENHGEDGIIDAAIRFAEADAQDGAGAKDDLVTSLRIRHGQVRRVAWRLTELRGSDRACARVIAVGMDITEQIQLQEELNAERNRLQSFLDGLYVFVGQYDLDGKLLHANLPALVALGLKPADVIGKPFWETPWVAHSADTQAQIRRLIATAATGQIVREDVQACIGDGRTATMDAMFGPMRDTKGQIIGVVGSGSDITARVEAEHKLKESEDRFRELIEGANDMIYRMSLPDGTYEYVSPSAQDVTGFAAEAIVENPLLVAKAIHPDDRNLFEAEWKKLMAGIVEPRYQYRIIGEDGKTRWISQTNRGVFDENSRLIALEGVCRNETKQVELEQAKRRSENQLRSFFEASLPALAMVDRQGRFVTVNQTFAAFNGTSIEDHQGKTPGETLPPSQAAEIEKGVGIILSGLATETNMEMETQKDTKSKDRRHWLYSFFPFRDEKSEILGVGIVAVDVTEEKRARETARETSARLREAQRLGRLGAWELDIVRDKLRWSDEIFDLFEVHKGDFDPSFDGFLSLVHPEDRNLVEDTYLQSLETGEPYNVIHRLQMRDGRVKWVEERGESEFDHNRIATLSRGTVQDITEIKQAELQALKLAKINETLIREVHHRVKNNLQIISSLLYFGNRKLADSDSAGVLDDISARLKAMVMVHERLYRSTDVGRIEIVEYARSLVAELGHIYRKGKAPVTIDVLGENIHVPMDVALPCGSLICELVTNSLKHAFPPKVGGQIKVKISRCESRIDFSVFDDGPGLPDDFDLESASSFGWLLVRNIVDQLDARVDYRTSPGAMVSVSIPLQEDVE